MLAAFVNDYVIKCTELKPIPDPICSSVECFGVGNELDRGSGDGGKARGHPVPSQSQNHLQEAKHSSR